MTSENLATIERLERKLQARKADFDSRDAYYEGEQRLDILGLTLPPQFDKLRAVINWPALVVNAISERLDVEGFRLGGNDRVDERVWEWWQLNRLDSEAPLAHTDALVQGDAYATVGVHDQVKGAPIITVESSADMTAEIDPRTRRVVSALRLFNYSEDGTALSCALYTPQANLYYDRRPGAPWRLNSDWSHEHKLGRTMVVPLRNRARLKDVHGRSAMKDIIPLTDAACRSLTNLQGAQELLAVPARYVLGASQGDFIGADGQAKTSWEAYIGRFLALENENATVGHVPAADLRNFHETLTAYARHVSALSGLPSSYLGFTSENPPSADAIRAGEARLIKRAERAGTSLGDGWEEVVRLSFLAVDRKLPDGAERCETVWRDPATPTFSAKADAVVKLFQARGGDGKPLLPREAAWEELGYSATKRRRLMELTNDDPAVRYLAAMDQLPEPGEGADDDA